ncbi:MAG: translational GTPase TypA [Lachnospiraceae bacterium]
MKISREDIRNIAIIAHVDHGKTTLVDELLKQSGVFRENQEVAERVMDSNDIERERGITILSKNTAVMYDGIKINIIDTPGHADFGGEVERVLKMVNGVVLVVDAFEGPMPQTKFVLKKALELSLPVIVCVNKIDRPEARPDEIMDEVLELFLELDADDEQLDSPFVYASAKAGIAMLELDDNGKDMKPLFETIIDHIPAPTGDPDADTQVLISTIDYNEYVGRIGIGKVDNGSIKVNQDCVVVNAHDPEKANKVKISKLYEFDGLNRVEVQEAGIGSIVAISGIPNIHIGDTICSLTNPQPIPFQKISEPTISMQFLVNDSPLAGREGKYVTTRHIRDRLFRELNTDVSLRVEEIENSDSYKVSGRGELHLSVLIENMRREGYEFAVSKAEVLYKKDENGKKLEPMEIAIIDVPEEFSGTIIEKLSQRKGELQGMSMSNTGYSRLEFSIPSRGLIGYRGEFLTDTKGTGIMNTLFNGYGPYKGDIQYRKQGSLIAYESGETITYGLFNAQERGTLFVGPGEKVYAGMVIGQNGKTDDIEVNVCKTKKLTNTRASGSDDALKLTPPKILSLEQALEFIDTDELLEITPKNIRIRKKILDPTERMRAARRQANS